MPGIYKLLEIHNANHRLIGEPDFPSMSAVLQKAVARVSQNNVSLKREADYKVKQFKYAYWSAKRPGIGHRLMCRILKAKSKLLRMLGNQLR